jgi:sugar lactone lactonase YvrE
MTPKTVLEGLAFAEGPRWHDGALYFSDMHDGIIWRLTPEGVKTKIAEVPGLPSGLGWLPDGSLCVVSMTDRLLLRHNDQGFTTYAKLTFDTPYPINDMVIDHTGRAYIGGFGFDLNKNEAPRPSVLFCVETYGSVRVAAENLLFPNGMVITPDHKMLIVAETFAARLTAFTMDADGFLTNRHTFADLKGIAPDGICLDEQGGIWVGCPNTETIIRVKEGGEVTDTIALPGRHSYACVLGGSDRRDLYICTAQSFYPEQTKAQRAGKIEVVRVNIPGAGLP